MLDYFANRKSKKHHHDSKKEHHHKEEKKRDHDHHRHHEHEHEHEHEHDHRHDRHHDHHHHHDHHRERHHRDDSPVLSPQDEQFLERIVSEDNHAISSEPDLLDLAEAGEAHGNELQLVVSNDASRYPELDFKPDEDELDDEAPRDREVDDHKKSKKSRKEEPRSSSASNRWSFMQRLGRNKSKDDHDRDHRHSSSHSKNKRDVTPGEAAREEDDLTAVLENLNLASENKKAFSLSKESRELVKQFAQILQDTVNGVPTAVDDLTKLLDSSHEQLEKSYGRLPSYLQKLVRTLPKKMTTTMAPELLATAAEKQGASSAQAVDMKQAAQKAGVRMPSLQDMITKPGAAAGMLKAIMNFLKLRWPAFMGANVLWSLGLFLLLLVFWYCHKRGREVRVAKEKAAANYIDGRGRVEELDDRDDDSIEVEEIIDDADPRQPSQQASTSAARY